MDGHTKNKLLDIAHKIIRSEDLSLEQLKDSVRNIYEDLCILNYLEGTDKPSEKKIPSKPATPQQNLTQTLPLDQVAAVFQNAPAKESAPPKPPKSPAPVKKQELKNSFKNFKTQQQQTKNTSPIKIGLNDRIAFVKFLFQNEMESYQRVVSDLNQIHTHEKSLAYFARIAKEREWNHKNEVTLRFKKLIKHRFKKNIL